MTEADIGKFREEATNMDDTKPKLSTNDDHENIMAWM